MSSPQPATTLPVGTIDEAKHFLFVDEVLGVATDEGDLLGRFASCSDATFVLRVAPQVEAEIPVEDIRRIERVSRYGVQGAVTGAAIGGIPLAIFAWPYGMFAGSGSGYVLLVVTLGAIPLLGAFGGLGGIIGMCIKRRQAIYVARA